MTPLRLLAAACCLLFARAVSGEELSVQADKENVVASRLEGTWQRNAALTQRLTGRAGIRIEGTGKTSGVTFKSDPSVAGKVPEKYVRILNERHMQVYLAGYLNLAGKDLPFVLTQAHGNPYVLFWLERDGDPFGNGESFNVMLAVAKDKGNDLLFIGGDFNNQPFSAFERKKTEGEE